ncbi:hypothetical protein K7W42_10480 [Deinococcus sp. HMF7604]|uniref:hypothetical protein n=1 Tax=Deinococcus betulae TaxID=2873312 RepID=UPI001CCFD5FD|nr:hypothetical protein [Deinococcus betulae]MBZ9751290.1 hypothetical protein [Deinococcus betulae]
MKKMTSLLCFAALASALTACAPGPLRKVFGNPWKNEPFVQLVGQNIAVVTSRFRAERIEHTLGYTEYFIEYCGQTGRTITTQDYSGRYFSEAERVCGWDIFRTDKAGLITAYYERGNYSARPYIDDFKDLLK